MAVTGGSQEGVSVASGEKHSQDADAVSAQAQAFSKSWVRRLLDGKWIYEEKKERRTVAESSVP